MRLPVVVALLTVVFVAAACTTTSRTGPRPPALDPGGGLAIYPASDSSEGMAACVANILRGRLSKLRILSGDDALALAFGSRAEHAMQPLTPKLLEPAVRERLEGAGISYLVTIYNETNTSYDSGGIETWIGAMFWKRESRAQGIVYEAASGKDVASAGARAEGPTGFVSILIIPIVPILAFTESRVCKTVGNDLADAFAGVEARNE